MKPPPAGLGCFRRAQCSHGQAPPASCAHGFASAGHSCEGGWTRPSVAGLLPVSEVRSAMLRAPDRVPGLHPSVTFVKDAAWTVCLWGPHPPPYRGGQAAHSQAPPGPCPHCPPPTSAEQVTTRANTNPAGAGSLPQSRFMDAA
ncbi:Hypothetical predicted protein [Marmota monax]|uniref:Uncharacterized protein n=1 Tax=Marmota monax TaxID=9995 RepID=A0A5E4CQQ4_MARMO|nr:Hypothetical predicted protein [Marmota monax]